MGHKDDTLHDARLYLKQHGISKSCAKKFASWHMCLGCKKRHKTRGLLARHLKYKRRHRASLRTIKRRFKKLSSKGDKRTPQEEEDYIELCLHLVQLVKVPYD